MYQRQGKSAFKKDLSNTVAFCEHLGHPEKQFKSIHVAGTNGKGSTSHMMAAMLQNAGYKVGLYTSPHLKILESELESLVYPSLKSQSLILSHRIVHLFINYSRAF